MQNQTFVRLTELPSPPATPHNNTANEMYTLPKPNFNEQCNSANISYIDAADAISRQWIVSKDEAYLNDVLRQSTKPQRFNNSAHLNEAVRRDTDQQNSLTDYAYVDANPCPEISKRNSLYLKVDNVTPPAAQTGRRVGKL